MIINLKHSSPEDLRISERKKVINISDTEQERSLCACCRLLFILGRNADLCGTLIVNMIGLFTRSLSFNRWGNKNKFCIAAQLATAPFFSLASSLH
jgi:hypothetical protein